MKIKADHVPIKKPLLKKELNNYVALFIIVLVSFLVYLPVLHNGFLNWDDDNYIQNNSLIYSIHIKEYFTQFFIGNYHPLTLLALGIEYKLFGLNETGYHAVNLVLHLLNVILVFYSILLLSEKAEVALLASLLFGIHPIHVESVAWASELKDLLYTLFFLLSFVYYLKYINDNSKKYYLYGLLFFILSLLSKGMAVSFPALMFLIDYFKERKLNKKTILEKIPFLILALIFGIVAVIAQKASGAIQDYVIFTFPQRIVFASYGFVTYLIKLLLPIQLCAYYPYPVKSIDAIPIQYYFYLPILLGIIYFTFFTIRFSKKIIFGIGFFAITVFLVLQLLPVGGTIMAYRYSYIPSIGIFYLASEGLVWLSNKKNKALVISILTVFTIFFSIKTYSRCFVWKDGASLWDDVINQYKNVPLAFNNRGFIFYREKKYDEAMSYYDKTIELSPNFYMAYNNRGVLMAELRRNKEALSDYNKVIELKPDLAEPYNNRGLLLVDEKKFAEAINDYNKAIELNPAYSTAYNNRGNLMLSQKKYPEALVDYNMAIKLQPNYAKAYTNRGAVFSAENKISEALSDFNKSIELEPDYSQAYFNRGVLLMNEKRNDEALIDYAKSIELDPNNRAPYFNRAVIFQSQEKFDEALKDYKKAIELDSNISQPYFNRGLILIKVKRYEDAINDFSKFIELDSTNAMAFYSRGIAEYYINKKNIACTDIYKAANMGLQPARDLFNKFCQ